MDYSHTTFFPGAPPYQFMGAAQVPLTPSHSNSVASEDYNNTSSPEIFDQYPSGIPPEQFQQNFDGYVQFNHGQAFPGPPTPPGQLPVHASVPPANGAVHQAGPTSEISKLEAEENRRQGSNSEDDDLTPAQSRRKAQNRAAQRAFRERKERHVKDLENRLNELEQAQTEAMSENERLKRDLQKMETENEILRATSMVAPSSGSPAAAVPTTTGPMTYSPTDFYSNVLQGHANKSPSHRVVTSEKGERLLAAGATWEVIINHELFKRGLVDVSAVSERLKPQAKCDGQGPVFEESAILEAIELSVGENSDELI
jgi:AP-1-like factor